MPPILIVVFVLISALLELDEPEANVIEALSISVFTSELSFKTTLIAFLISLFPAIVIVLEPLTEDCNARELSSIALKLADDEPAEAVLFNLENTFRLFDLRLPALTVAFV